MNKLLEKPITLAHLRERRDEILALVQASGGERVRVFGSVARGEATDMSDVDFLIQFRKGTSLWDVIGLWQDLSDLLGCAVNVISENTPHDRLMQNAHRDAVDL